MSIHGLLLVGLNHATAPLALRELLALDATEQQALLDDLRHRGLAGEAMTLCTCNRVEIYLAGDAPVDLEPVAEALARVRNVPIDRFIAHLYLKRGREAAEHLFCVASSLDSMVLGETQILGQVRDAYERATAAGHVAGVLHPLLQRALGVGKQVLSGTALAEGRLSVASVAVDYARQIFERFDDKTVLTIGAGKMTRLVLGGFADLKPGRLIVVNRDLGKAKTLAQQHRGQAAALESLDEQLVQADVVLTCTASHEPIITRARFDPLLRKRRYRPIFLIDLAVPRDIEPAVAELQSVYLYNLDDLQQVVSQTMAKRTDAVSAARAVVTQNLEAYLSWHRQRSLGPMIERLYQRYHALAEQELQRTLARLPDIGEPEREHLRELTRRIVNKLLHDPIRNLREGESPHAMNLPYLHALEKLFGLPPASDDAPTADDNPQR